MAARKLEPKFGAVLGAAGAVCGVSASISVGFICVICDICG